MIMFGINYNRHGNKIKYKQTMLNYNNWDKINLMIYSSDNLTDVYINTVKVIMIILTNAIVSLKMISTQLVHH